MVGRDSGGEPLSQGDDFRARAMTCRCVRITLYGSVAFGIWNVNNVPAASFDCTLSVPPWDLAISDAM